MVGGAGRPARTTANGNPAQHGPGRRRPTGAIVAIDGSPARTETDRAGAPRRLYAMPSLAHALVSVRFGMERHRGSDERLPHRNARPNPAERILADITRRPARGNDVVLTIDPKVQAQAEALATAPAPWWPSIRAAGRCWRWSRGLGFDPGAIDEQGDALCQGCDRRAGQPRHPGPVLPRLNL
ncbi:MAG: hypothetical protein U0531_06655 [Dehalococcoidia bacterium]